MEWSVGFEGVELKTGCFSIEEELHWKQAVDKLHKIFKGQNK